MSTSPDETPWTDRIRAGWLSEELPSGDRRWWTRTGRRFTSTSTDRVRIRRAIDTIDWYPPRASLPWWEGRALTEIVAKLQLNYVGELGISRDALAYPEPHPNDSGVNAPVEVASYSLVAVRQLIHHGWFTSYWLDTGTNVTCLATATETRDRPCGITIACALNRHRECPGTSTPTSRPCPCGCGCANRSHQ